MASPATAGASSKHLLIMCTNVGSLGCNNNLKEHNIKVRKKVIDTVTLIRDKYKSDNIALCAQECGHFDVTLRPHFDGPLACDDHVSFGADDNGVRGVATYLLGGGDASKVAATDAVNEMCTIIAQYRNNRGRLRKVGIINCYRNISRNYERSVEQRLPSLNKLMR